MFEFALQNVFAIDFKEFEDNETPVFLLFRGIDLPRKAAIYLNDYNETGFSLIIERESGDFITLKIYDLAKDEIYTSKGVITTKNALDRINFNSLNKKFLSIGEVITPREINLDHSLKIPLLSLSVK